MNFMGKINNYIRTKPFPLSFLLLGSVLGCVYFICWFIFYKILGGIDIVFTEIPTYEPTSITVILQLLILGPLLETLLFQKGVYFLLRQSEWLINHKPYIVIIGGVFFGLLHFFSLAYIIVTIDRKSVV